MPKGVYQHQPRGNKKQEILAAATRVYAHYGFEGATLDRMAEAAGVSKALVLQYFGSKLGLVTEIANTTVCRALSRMAGVDKTPGLTLRQRAERQAELMYPAREEWCLVIGTVLVPSFQFGGRGEIEGFLKSEYAAVLGHLAEFKQPGEDAACAYAYADLSMRIGYVVGGHKANYERASRALQNQLLLPEAEILAARSNAKKE